MLKQYPHFKRGQAEKEFKKLPKAEQKLIEDYIFYRKARGLGESKAKDLRRFLIQIRVLLDENFKDCDNLEKISQLAVKINESFLANETKKNIRFDLSNLFKYLFPDWSNRFRDLEIFRGRKDKGENSKSKNKTLNLPSDEDIEKMLKTENRTFWRTFLLIQATTGLRTGETRKIETKNISFDKDGTSKIEVYMSKNGNDKVVFCDKQATDYIKKLIQEQKNNKSLGKYLFHSKTDVNKPIHKNSVCKWFSELSLKATGKQFIPYSLRHKKATELYKLAKENKISEFTALRLLGHHKSMMNTYDKTPKEEEVKILKEQAFNMDISEEKKHELEKEIERLREEFTRKIEEIEIKRNQELKKIRELINKR